MSHCHNVMCFFTAALLPAEAIPSWLAINDAISQGFPNMVSMDTMMPSSTFSGTCQVFLEGGCGQVGLLES